MALLGEYSKNWTQVNDEILFYKSPSFAFCGNIVITELEGTLIKKYNAAKLYKNLGDAAPMHQQSPELIKFLKKKRMDVIIVSNHICRSAYCIDVLKQKIEKFATEFGAPFIGIFALRPNRFSKPFTGTWEFLQRFYNKHSAAIVSAVVCSCNGGCASDVSDIDRAYAHNCNIPFKTIGELTGKESSEMFQWNNNCIAVDKREEYIALLNNLQKVDVFDRVAQLNAENPATIFLIFVYGPPSSGKSTYCSELAERLNKTMGKSNVFMIVDGCSSGAKRHVAKYVANRIHVIVDGGCHSARQRDIIAAGAECAKKLYVEVNPSLRMSMLFNHVAVETDKKNVRSLYNVRKYHEYRSLKVRPVDELSIYCPTIQPSALLMNFRF